MANQIEVKAGLDTNPFDRGLTHMQKGVAKFSGGMSRAFTSALGPAALGAGIVAGLGMQINRVVRQADEVSDLAEAWGENAHEMTQVFNVAKILGADGAGVIGMLRKVKQNAGEVALGNKEAAEGFAMMGLSVEDIKGKGLPDLLATLAAGFQKAEERGLGVVAATKVMGRGAGQMIGLLQQSPEALRETFAAAAGASDKAIMKIGEWTDKWAEFWQKADEITANILGEKIIPLLEKVGEKMAAWRDYDKAWKSAESAAPAMTEKQLGRKSRAVSVLGMSFGDSEWRRANAANELKVALENLQRSREDREAAKPKPALRKVVGGATEGAGSASGEKAASQLQKTRDDVTATAEELERSRLTEEQQVALLERRKAGYQRVVDLGRDAQQTADAQLAVNKLQLEIDKKRADMAKDREEKEAAAKKEDQDAKLSKIKLSMEEKILGLKSAGRQRAIEEANLRLRAAEAEFQFHKGSSQEAAARLEVLRAQKALADAMKPDRGTKDERMAEKIRGGMSISKAEREIRREDRQDRNRDRTLKRYERTVGDQPDLIDGKGVDARVGRKTIMGGREVGEAGGPGQFPQAQAAPASAPGQPPLPGGSGGAQDPAPILTKILGKLEGLESLVRGAVT